MEKHYFPFQAQQQGFTLVELSIVLVILGLLIGGVLTGQSLIRAAELRSISTTHARYLTALHTFKDKYFALPGDMPNATAYWGATTCPGTNSGTTATCNGDSDGKISDEPTGGAIREERFRLWQHLANAGLIEGNYTGIRGAGNTAESVPGENVPKGKMGEGWTLVWTGTGNGSTGQYATDYGHRMIVGKFWANDWTKTPFLKPEEIYNIDMKTDDGMPGNGKILTYHWQDCSTSATNTDFTGSYKLTNTAQACALIYRYVI